MARKGRRMMITGQNFINLALDTFSEWKTVYVDYSGRLQRAQIDRGRE